MSNLELHGLEYQVASDLHSNQCFHSKGGENFRFQKHEGSLSDVMADASDDLFDWEDWERRQERGVVAVWLWCEFWFGGGCYDRITAICFDTEVVSHSQRILFLLNPIDLCSF